MTHERRDYSGAAPETTLAGGIGPNDISIPVANGTGYPSGPNPFFIAIDQGTSIEEKVRCSSRSGNILTVAPGGRGADGTVATSHVAGATTKVNHVLTALDLDEANAHYANTGLDHHGQYMKADGTRHDGTARHSVLPWGPLVAPAIVTADQVGVGTTITDLTGLTAMVTVGTGRCVRASAHGIVQQVGANGTPIVYLREGTTQLGRVGQITLGTSEGAAFDGSVVLTPTAGAHTYKLSLHTTAGTANLLAGATYPAHLLIEDIGPA